MISVSFDADTRLTGVKMGLISVEEARVGPTSFGLERIEESVFSDIQKKLSGDSLKDDPIINSFRQLYWSFHMDPTKLRVSSEALIRRVLSEQNLWRVNNAVDAINLASAATGFPISAWDRSKIEPPLTARVAKPGDIFIRIGGREIPLKGHELVVADQKGILTLGFASADAEHCKITVDSESILLAVYGTADIKKKELLEAMDSIMSRLGEFLPGKISTLGTFIAP